MNAPFHREHDSIYLAIFRRVVEALGTAKDIHRIFESAKKAVVPEVGDLFFGMSGDPVGKCDFQRTPMFSVLIPFGKLLAVVTRRRELKGGGEIVPKRIAIKIRVPRRL